MLDEHRYPQRYVIYYKIEIILAIRCNFVMLHKELTAKQDVLLLSRRNEGLESLLRDHLREIRAANATTVTTAKGKGRKK